MTVIILDAAKKAAIVTIYKAGTRTIQQLAMQAGVARSTIRRILNDAGIYTPEQIKQDNGKEAMNTLARFNMSLSDLSAILIQLRDLDMIKEVNGHMLINYTPSRSRMLTECKNMEEGTWAAFLNEVVTARVAAAHNKHVDSAMLRINEKVEKNARDDGKKRE